MLSFGKSFARSTAAILVGLAFAGSAFGIDAVNELERSVAAFVAAGNYRAASTAAFNLAKERKSLGETTKACAALSQSLEYYRKANAADEPALSSIGDDSDGMAVVRAKFGCTKAL
jgi:hypothetical protein